ncbi:MULTISPECIES: response regulator [unclassified Leisingera]|uniref:response regulator n=1 Tax=unclassified Leisingera TaxID=2614906 RepID=UPI00030403CF|nr:MULTISPECIES: response regulator [unclassified Leisingera]KIC18369.1 response regulator [Leisingera sp. ANG-DT]KIC24204.1 response regulator [Leisingera sp. ANG-S3]KIC26986.1 response regulator [Leisingera sp. ANG-M6]KIC33037.1 response regulator [Leisingera sp. ANG-S5]KIC52920.1 response regulator [Leisingera sp. ANG-S]
MTAKVLLLEDDKGVRFTFEMALRDAGYDVTAVASCSEAISALSGIETGILILDLKIGEEMSLPVADYAALMRPDIPVVYITGSRLFTGGELFGLSRNIRWVLHKPVNLPDLVSMVDYVTGQSVTAEAS